MEKHLVYLHEGLKIMTGDELNALDPSLWHGAKPLDQVRFISGARLDSEYNPVIYVLDKFTAIETLTDPSTNQPWANKSAAEAWAATQNTTQPTLEAAYLAAGAIEVTDAAAGTAQPEQPATEGAGA